MKFVCGKCGRTEETDTRDFECSCGGLWQLDYRPEFSLKDIDKGIWNQFRYHSFMALEEEVWKEITLGEGLTDIIKDGDLLFKMDYMMPTLSFKDRGASVLISHCKSIQVEEIIQDSSGNAGNSIAAYAARAGIRCHIFVPDGTSPKKIAMIEGHGAKVSIIEGSRDQCAEAARKKAREEKIYYASHVYNPYFYEGTKTYIYEVYEQLGRIPDSIMIPVGNGTLFIGVVKGLEDLKRSGLIGQMPRIFAVQSENCNPLQKAREEGKDKPVEVDPRPTKAEGIAIGIPLRGEEILAYSKTYNIQFLTASEKIIEEARSLLAEKGTFVEPTTAAVFGGYLEHKEKYGIGECLISLCGAGLKGK
ncbi:MAG: threonine synthase [Gallicola sp.]|nr:threonine synthase [Gallicola sp.]